MKKKIAGWWEYFTSPAFRHWTHLHDMESFMAEIERHRRDMLEYQSHQMFLTPSPEEPK